MADGAETAQEGEETSDAAQELRPEQQLCVALVIEGKTRKQIAEEIGYSKRQIDRWLESAAVKEAIAQEARDGLARARHVLTGKSVEAAKSLGDLATKDVLGSAAANQVKVAASRAVIELAIKFSEHAGDAAPTKHEISGPPISLRIVDPLKAEQEHGSDGSPASDDDGRPSGT